MRVSKNFLKIIVQLSFVIIIFSTVPAKSLDKFRYDDRISDYFSGILLLNNNNYEQSFQFLKKLKGLESSHKNYSLKYLYSLVNTGNIVEAFLFSKKLEKQNLESFESLIITGVYYLKNSKIDLAKEYFLRANNIDSRLILNAYVSNSLYNWVSVKDLSLEISISKLNKLDKRFENLKKIQNVFLNCYYDSRNTKNLFNQLITDKETDFSRYNFFYASYALRSDNKKEAENILEKAIKSYPRNLLLNQFKIDLKKNKNSLKFDCRKVSHVISEILYITANALSSQSIYPLSNFYLNLAKYLNPDFHPYNTLLAENYYKIDNYNKAKQTYKDLAEKGDAFKWYSTKQLARILINENKKDDALKILKEGFNDLENKDIYEIFDYAELLKNNEQFKQSIIFYSKIIKNLTIDHPLYPEVTDGRGVAYERVGEWEKAEKDLLNSLSADPEQAYVINYLAYSWIEKGIKIEKSLKMLEKANKLKTNDPYITDSLGWALFKLERYKESKDYLQLAVRLMPGDPIVNDHFGDVLWKNGNKIQARYYWDYVLSLEETEDDLKQAIKKKLIKGL